MNVRLTLNGADITESVISYERIQTICDGVGSISMECAAQTMPAVTPWDLIVLWEGGNKKGEYNVLTSKVAADTGIMGVSGQDDSALLINYFISDSYPDINDGSLAKVWIEKFLTEAHVRYTITAASGNQVNNHSAFGLMSAYDQIMMLLAMNGWYMYFNPNGRAIVGEINANTKSPAKYYDHDIISINTVKHDKQLRNRAVVWGKGGIWAEEKCITPYNYDSKDYRTVVASNSYITNPSTLALKLLDTYAHINFEPTITFEGARNVKLADFILISSSYWYGDGMVTTVGSNMDATGGLTTNVTLDQKCPRLFTGFGYTSYVYVGTNGAGVWRKELGTDTWEAFSAGLDAADMDIQDLMVKNNTFACVANHKPYINLGAEFADWKICDTLRLVSRRDYITQAANNFPVSMFDCMACDIQEGTNIVMFEFKLKDENKSPSIAEDDLSFQVYVNPVTRDATQTPQLWIRNEFAIDGQETTGTNAKFWEDFRGIGIESFGPQELPTAVAPWYYGLSNMEGLFGSSQVSIDINPDPYGYTFGPLADDVRSTALFMGHFYGDVNIVGSEVISLWYYHGILNNMFCVGDQTNFFPPNPDSPPGSVAYGYPSLILGPNKDFPAMWPTSNYVIRKRHIYHDTTQVEDKTTGKFDTPNYDVIDFVEDISTGEFYYASYTLGKIYDVKFAHLEPVYNWANCVSIGNVSKYGLGSVDGYALVPLTTIILVVGQSNPLENGLYMPVSVTDPWVRLSDPDISKRGAIIHVLNGDTYDDTYWQVVLENDPVLDVDNVVIKQILQWTSNGMTKITDLATETNDLLSIANIHSNYGWNSVASNGTHMWIYKSSRHDVSAEVPAAMGVRGAPVTTTWWFTSFNNKTGFIKEKLFDLTSDVEFGGGGWNPLVSVVLEVPPILLGSPEKSGMGMLFTVNDWATLPGAKHKTAVHYLIKAINMGGETSIEKVDLAAFSCDLPDGACDPENDCIIQVSEQRSLKCTYTGNVITGDVVDPHYALFMEARAEIIWDKCAYDCLANSGRHEQILGMSIRGSLLTTDKTAQFEYRISTPLPCDSWIHPCTANCMNASLLPSNAEMYYNLPGAALDFTKIKLLTTRSSPQFLYDGKEIRDGTSMGVMFPLEHPITPGSTRQIFPQADDFDGSYYISEMSNQCVYKELAGSTTGTIEGFSTAAGYGMDEVNNTFVCNVFALGRDEFWNAQKNLYVMNPWDLYQDKEVCFLLKPDKVKDDGSYQITDFDFYEFDTEGSTILAPLVSHTYGSNLVTYSYMGTIRTGNQPQNFKKYNSKYKGASVSGEWNDIKSARINAGVPIFIDGANPPKGGSYALTTAGLGNMYNNPNTPDVTNVMLFNLDNLAQNWYFQPFFGQVGTVETSHFYYPPYFYTSISGVLPPLVPSGSIFWERVPGDIWDDRSTGAPSSVIVVTRLDDRM